MTALDYFTLPPQTPVYNGTKLLADIRNVFKFWRTLQRDVKHIRKESFNALGIVLFSFFFRDPQRSFCFKNVKKASKMFKKICQFVNKKRISAKIIEKVSETLKKWAFSRNVVTMVSLFSVYVLRVHNS
jgi:hypothetical protein